MIKAIIFDCFGVLTADKWKEFTATLPHGEALQTARDLNAAYDAGMITLDEFLSGVYEATGREPELVEALLDSETGKNHQLLAYIADLKQHHKIGLLSNIATNWIRDSFLTSDEQSLFDAMVMSYEAKMTKPDPRIYKLICSKLAVDPSEAIMIDDIDRYCLAAEQLGMKSVVYTDFVSMRSQLEKLLTNTDH